MIDLTQKDYEALNELLFDCWPEEYAWGAVTLFKLRNGLDTPEEREAWNSKVPASMPEWKFLEARDGR